MPFIWLAAYPLLVNNPIYKYIKNKLFTISFHYFESLLIFIFVQKYLFQELFPFFSHLLSSQGSTSAKKYVSIVLFFTIWVVIP